MTAPLTETQLAYIAERDRRWRDKPKAGKPSSTSVAARDRRALLGEVRRLQEAVVVLKVGLVSAKGDAMPFGTRPRPTCRGCEADLSVRDETRGWCSGCASPAGGERP